MCATFSRKRQEIESNGCKYMFDVNIPVCLLYSDVISSSHLPFSHLNHLYSPSEGGGGVVILPSVLDSKVLLLLFIILTFKTNVYL